MQSQQNMCGEVAEGSAADGGGVGEMRAGAYRQWPLQTPSMINVKGFRFLICQSFQRRLTYGYLQPRRSHHSGRSSGTSEPITSRLCCGCRCQRCKLAHLQPFIMHFSKEQLVFLGQARCRTNVKCCKCDILHTKRKSGGHTSQMAGVTFLLVCSPLMVERTRRTQLWNSRHVICRRKFAATSHSADTGKMVE